MAIVKNGRQQYPAIVQEVIFARETVNPGNLADGAGETVALTIAGAALGDIVLCGPGADVIDVLFSASVVAANSVEIRFQNESTGARDIASSTWNIFVIKPAVT